MLAVELAGQGSWVDAPNWAVNGGSPTYLGNSAGVSDLGLLAVIELAAVGFVDKQRTAETGEKRLYPGGSFDPLGACCALRLSRRTARAHALAIHRLCQGRHQGAAAEGDQERPPGHGGVHGLLRAGRRDARRPDRRAGQALG